MRLDFRHIAFEPDETLIDDQEARRDAVLERLHPQRQPLFETTPGNSDESLVVVASARPPVAVSASSSPSGARRIPAAE